MSQLADPLDLVDHDNFDVRGSWNRLYRATLRHMWMVVATTLATIGLIVAYIWIWPPVFEAEVGFMLEREMDPARDTFYTGWAVFRKDDIETETMLMTSGPILVEVVKDLELNYDEVYHTFLGWTKHLWRESWPGKKYREIKEHLFPRKPSAFDPTDEELEFGKVLHDFGQGVSVRRLGESHVGLLTVKASSPRAAEMANAVFDLYVERRMERYMLEANRAFDSLNAEDMDVRRELEGKEADLKHFFESTGLVFDFEREKIEVGKWIDMRTTLVGMASNLAGLDARLAVLDEQLAQEERQMVGSRGFEKNALKRELEMTRMRYETALIETLSLYHPDSPEVRNIESNIASLTERIEQAEEMVASSHTEVMNSTYKTLHSERLALVADRTATLASRMVLANEERTMSERLSGVPAKRADFEILMRDVGQLRNKYLNVHTRLLQADVSRATAKATMPSLRLVEYATPSGDPSWPRTKLLLLSAACVGIFLGIGAALLRDLFLAQVRLEDVVAGRGQAGYYGRIQVGVDRQLFDVQPGRAPGSSMGGGPS